MVCAQRPHTLSVESGPMPKKIKRVSAVAGEVNEPKQFVEVRALARGYYGHVIRNPEDVFLIDVADLKEMADVDKAEVDDTNPVSGGGTDYDLPSWVEAVEGPVDPAKQIPKGCLLYTSDAADERSSVD